MADPSDDTEKQHDPTQKRLDDARKKGEVVRSQDLNAAGAYLGLCLMLVALGGGLFEGMGALLAALLANAGDLGHLAADSPASVVVGGLLARLAPFVALLFGVPLLGAVLSIVAQRSLVFSGEKLAPKLSRISPLANFKNKFGIDGLFEFAKSTAKLAIYSLALVIFLVRQAPRMLEAQRLPPGQGTALMLSMALEFVALAVLIALVIGGVDYLYQFQAHLRKNRMSHQELKDEVKTAEGDPHIKGQRRQRATAIATNRMLQDVPDASVVNVNPTHFAVALKWAPLTPGAPVCVAKGTDEIAARIREKAAEAGVPVHSDPPTARALFATVDIGAEIPRSLYKPVAAAIRFAEKMRRLAARRA